MARFSTVPLTLFMRSLEWYWIPHTPSLVVTHSEYKVCYEGAPLYTRSSDPLASYLHHLPHIPTYLYYSSMWQCICTLFAGRGKTETSCHRWKHIEISDPEHEKKADDIISR
jgi:hypothetical protein